MQNTYTCICDFGERGVNPMKLRVELYDISDTDSSANIQMKVRQRNHYTK